MIPGDVASWGRRQNSQLFKKFYTREYDMGGAVSPDVAKLAGDVSVCKLTQSLRGDRRSDDIAS